jgi:NAD(P)-dependent dehydrogenase (short-subunit alcohol dehydrogenase family)
VHRRWRGHGGGAGAGLKVLVLGASRGIGLEFVRQYGAAGDDVIATARDEAGLERLRALGARALKLDVSEPASISGLGWQLDGEKLDVAIYVAGVMSRGGATAPPARDDFDRVMRTNVWGAMQAIPQVAPLVESAGGKFVFISSGMGQITGVDSSYSWVYRASKAALNMTVAAAQPDYPNAVLVAMNPGWVQTDMGGGAAPLKPEDSVAGMRRAIAKLTPADRGTFHDHEGRHMGGW